jgi:hypothetical protein
MDSTEDSGPMKPGNSVEDKTLTTGTQREGRAPWQQPVQLHLWENPDGRNAPTGRGKSWTKGESDTDRESIQWMKPGTSKSEEDSELCESTEPESRRGHQLPGPGRPANHPRPSLAEGSHGGCCSEVERKMEGVYDRRRLHGTWNHSKEKRGCSRHRRFRRPGPLLLGDYLQRNLKL